jgi:CRISPR-associated protein Csb2
MPVSSNYTPNSKGNVFLGVTTAGRLKELDEVFLFKDGIRRPPPLHEQSAAYRKGRTVKGEHFPQYEMVPIRLPGVMMSADSAGYIGRALRRAVMSKLGDDAPAAVHGHNHIDHVGWLSLPDVGHPHARGRIVGMAIAFPECLTEDERLKIRSALNRIDSVKLDDGRDITIDPLKPDFLPPKALQLQTWIRSSSVWATVTPIVLDRPPKKAKHERLCRAVAESVLNAGYPAPVEVDVSPFSYFAGSPPAFTVPVKKPRYHATIRFEHPVTGPVIAGRLRYFGIGLFRPVS